MFHKGGTVPRLVAVQGISWTPPRRAPVGVDIEGLDGVPADTEPGQRIQYQPIYRHPIDDDLVLEPCSSTVLHVKRRVEELLEGRFEFNHVLIQLYRKTTTEFAVVAFD